MGCSESKSLNASNTQNAESNKLIKNEKNEKNDKKSNLFLSKSSSRNRLKNSNGRGFYCKNGLLQIKTQNQKKEPMQFTIKIVETKECNIYVIKLNAKLFLVEYMIPIWFEKNTCIKFITKGKWRLDKNYDFTDSSGMPSSKNLDFNYGALVARVGFGPPFLLSPKEYTYKTKNEGPLYLRMNLPKKIKVNPEGFMEIKIFDGSLMSEEEINEKMGWKGNDLKYDVEESSELENSLINDMNNLRMNPTLFLKKIIAYQKIIWTENFLEKIKYNNDNIEMQPFSIDNELYIEIHNFVALNFDEIDKNLGNRNQNKYLEELQQQISIFIKNKFLCDNISKCKVTKNYRSIDICVNFLLDKKFRKYIFNKDYRTIVVNIYDNFFDEELLVILALLKGKKENKEEKKEKVEEEMDEEEEEIEEGETEDKKAE